MSDNHDDDPLAALNARMEEIQAEPDVLPELILDEDGGGGGGGAAATLVQIAETTFSFLQDQTGAIFADIEEGAMRRTVSLDSAAFGNELRRRYSRLTGGNVVRSDAIKTAREQIIANAELTAPPMTVALRTHRHSDRIYIDLADDRWRAVEISASGWKIVERVEGFRFRRTSAMEELPAPQEGGRLDDFRSVINVSDEDGYDLSIVVLWLLAAITNGPYPILAISGPDGSTKSTTSRLIGSIIDPSKFPTKLMPKKEDDLILNCHNQLVQSYDNLSRLGADIMDTICSISTGISLSKRKLYNDTDMAQIKVMAPLILNGISDLMTRRDISTRALPLRLVPPKARMTEAEVNRKFAETHPKLLGFLCSIAAGGLRTEKTMMPISLPRMADNAAWFQACASGFIEGEGDAPRARLVEMLATMDEELAAKAIESDPFARLLVTVLREIADTEPETETDEDEADDGGAANWAGDPAKGFRFRKVGEEYILEITAARLHTLLEEKAREINNGFGDGGRPIKDGSVPRVARMIGSYLDRISTALDRGGIEVGKRYLTGRAIYRFKWSEVDRYEIAFGF